MAPAGSRSNRVLSLAALIAISAMAAGLALYVDAKRVKARVVASALPAMRLVELPPPAERLFDQFVALGYSLDRVRSSGGVVPRIYLARLPSDLPRLDSSDQRKRIFLKTMLPLVLAENERILADRERLNRLDQRMVASLAISETDRSWLARLAEEYDVALGDRDELLRRVDAVPPSLALAQAALETGWGTSRAAQRGHAMFGQMSFRGSGELAIAEVKAFADMRQAVAAYARNLNSHRAYDEFRARRATMRAMGAPPDGEKLARHLVRYSERKQDYIRDVRAIIRANKLGAFDLARLDG